jgi:hypothetical protein
MVRYCGRDFSEADLALLQQLLRDRGTYPTRVTLSRALCEALDWRRPNGQYKDMSARQALLRMQADGLIVLPEPKRRGGGSTAQRTVAWTVASDPQPPITGFRGDLRDLCLAPVHDCRELALRREVIARYHYLGYTPLTGARMHYLIYDGNRFIGWTLAERERHLPLVVNNARFLILPWVHVTYLASAVLALAAQQLVRDRAARHHFRSVLLETFTDPR